MVETSKTGKSGREMTASSADKREKKLVKQQMCWNENNIDATLRTPTLTSFTAQSEGVQVMTGGAMEEALRDFLGGSTVG